MRAELASLNPCAVPFLSRAAVNLSWYDYTPYLLYLEASAFITSNIRNNIINHNTLE